MSTVVDTRQIAKAMSALRAVAAEVYAYLIRALRKCHYKGPIALCKETLDTWQAPLTLPHLSCIERGKDPLQLQSVGGIENIMYIVKQIFKLGVTPSEACHSPSPKRRAERERMERRGEKRKMANEKLSAMKGLLLAAVLMFVVASRVTKVSSVPQEAYIQCDLSDFAASANNETMSMEERLGLEPLRIPTPPPPPPTPPEDHVYALVVVDDIMKWVLELIKLRSVSWTEVEDWTINILEGGDNPFEDKFDIDFYHVETEFWVTGTMGLLDELHNAQNTFNWPDAYPDYYDCMVIMSGNIDGTTVGWGELLGDAFIISVKAAFLGMPVVNVFQHEASHLYGALDHKGLDGVTTWYIMSYTWQQFTRSWCGGCADIISANKHHFG